MSVGHRLYSCAMVCSFWYNVAVISYLSGPFASVLLLGLILIGCVFVGRCSAQGCVAGAFEKLKKGCKYLIFLFAFPFLFLGFYVNDPETNITVMMTPWKWRSLTQAPDGIWGALRLLVLWLIVLSYVLFAAFVIVFMFSFNIGSDRGVDDVFGVRGARSLRRKERGEFMGFSESSIPSRHVFHDIAVEGCDTAV